MNEPPGSRGPVAGFSIAMASFSALQLLLLIAFVALKERPMKMKVITPFNASLSGMYLSLMGVFLCIYFGLSFNESIYTPIGRIFFSVVVEISYFSYCWVRCIVFADKVFPKVVPFLKILIYLLPVLLFVNPLFTIASTLSPEPVLSICGTISKALGLLNSVLIFLCDIIAITSCRKYREQCSPKSTVDRMLLIFVRFGIPSILMSILAFPCFLLFVTLRQERWYFLLTVCFSAVGVIMGAMKVAMFNETVRPLAAVRKDNSDSQEDWFKISIFRSKSLSPIMGLDIIIIGGGMAGMLLALAMKRAGHAPTVYERTEFAEAAPGEARMPLFGKLGGGISIVINGARVLQQYGLWEEVQNSGGPQYNSQFCRIDGSQIIVVKPPTQREEVVFLARSSLHNILTIAAMKAGVRIVVGKQLVQFEQKPDENGKTKVFCRFRDGSGASGDVMIGADGIHSVTRSLLFDPVETDDAPIFTGSQGQLGVAQLPDDHPILKQIKYGLSVFTDNKNQNAVELMFISPNCVSFRISDFSKTNTEIEDYAPSTDIPRDIEKLSKLVKGWGVPDFVPEIIKHTIRVSPVSVYDRKSLKTWTKGHVTLIGDAAHGMPPHMGQGTNQAFEDVATLAEAFTRFPDDPQFCFMLYENLRIKRATLFQENSRAIGNAQYTKSTVGRVVGEIAMKVVNFGMANLGWRMNIDWDWNAEMEKELKRLGRV
ncbi:hypothetical protein HDU83_006609 [Entophlyctis luteolus]|nr:hypothetical protein HDU83_006609 [Entophlyctis luteolus]KAJ3379006.1 hypothetical protein HDU84_007128 [Entophlyctis sp. JEL0112]